MRYKTPVTTSASNGRKGRPPRGNAAADRLDPAGPVLTSAMAAERLQLHPRTIMERARAGQLPGAKLGHDWRFATEALDAAIRGEDWHQLTFTDAVLTLRQVAELLGMGPDKVARLTRTCVLPCNGQARARRYSRAAILRVLCRPIVPSSPAD